LDTDFPYHDSLECAPEMTCSSLTDLNDAQTITIQSDMTAELPMLDVFMPMMKSAAIIAAGRIGLFEALSDGPRDAASLAVALSASEQAIASLAEFLVTQSYLEQHGTTFANTPITSRWFTSQGIVDYNPGLIWTAQAWDLMSGLADSVKRGGPDKSLWDKMVDRPEMGSDFSRYMHAFARHLTTDLLDNIDLPPGASRMLDLGGSHGLHSISFCERHPELTAVIVDLESALSFTEDLIERKKMSDRISLLPGDLLHADWGTDYDVVFYLSVAHNQTAEDNLAIMQRIHQVLRPGGIVVIHEYLDDQPILAYHAAFKLTLLTETATRIFSCQEISQWLAEAGFAPPIRLDLKPIEKGSLLVARR